MDEPEKAKPQEPRLVDLSPEELKSRLNKADEVSRKKQARRTN